MTTESIIHWLRDKAARAGDHSYQRMLNAAAQRLEDLNRAQRWISVSEGLPPLHHESCDEDEDPFEFDVSDEVLGITLAGDLVIVRYTVEDGKEYWYEPDNGNLCEIDRWQPDPRRSVEV